MTITDSPVDNGVNVQALLGAREALSATPEAAEFTWRASCTWRNGTHSRSTVAGFTGLGAEQEHRTTYEFDVDHPECFASEDNGATPTEIVLVGLVGCLTAGVAAVAQHRGIQLRSVTATIEGQMNVLGILGADPGIRNGFEAITVRFAIDADASRDDLEALVAQSQKRSAVYRHRDQPDQGARRAGLTAHSPDVRMIKTTAVIVGAGHAGLAMSRRLTERSIDHVVLERGEVATLVADPALAEPAAAHSELADPAARPRLRRR